MPWTSGITTYVYDPARGLVAIVRPATGAGCTVTYDAGDRCAEPPADPRTTDPRGGAPEAESGPGAAPGP